MRIAASPGLAPGPSGAKPGMLLLHHEAMNWPAVRSSEPGRDKLSVTRGAMEGILRSVPTRRWLRAKDGGAGGSCNLTKPD